MTALLESYQAWKLSWKRAASDHQFLNSIIFSFLLLLVSFLAGSFANAYATAHASAPVSDLVLSSISSRNVFFWYAYGPLAFVVAVMAGCIAWPYQTPVVIKSLALFFIVRSLFVCLTHLGFPAGEIVPANAPWFIKHYFVGGDFFFSGHVGMPTLMALVFWKYPKTSAFFIACAVFFGVIVLIGHYHYSIDVAGAVLITPTIFNIGKYLFPCDFERASMHRA